MPQTTTAAMSTVIGLPHTGLPAPTPGERRGFRRRLGRLMKTRRQRPPRTLPPGAHRPRRVGVEPFDHATGHLRYRMMSTQRLS